MSDRSQFEISDAEFEAAKAEAVAQWGHIPRSLQDVIDRGGRFALRFAGDRAVTEVRAFVRDENGTETDITEAVKILWDGVVGSLDWGSGWWAAEDAAAVAWIGKLFGFDRPTSPGSSLWEWSVEGYAEAIAQYERHRAEIDSNLPPLL